MNKLTDSVYNELIPVLPRPKSEMKVLFIGLPNSASRPGKAGLFIPLGLAYLSAVLKNHGYKYDCIDLDAQEILHPSDSGDLWGHLNRFNFSSYNIVAFGGVFLKIKDLRYISQKIRKRNQDIFQIVGGQMGTVLADLIVQSTSVDCVGLYEGEQIILELVQCLQKRGDWRKINGLKYKNEEDQIIETPTRPKLKPNEIPRMPDRESWNFDTIRKAFPKGSPGRYSAVLFASRGCPFLCTFCKPQTGKEIRTREIDDMIYEIKHLKEKWNVQYFRFFDEVFIGSKNKISEFCNRIIQENLRISWDCQTQVRLVDKELLLLMKKAGCITLNYGIESGSDSILNEMKKGITADIARQAVEWTHEAGINPGANFLAGFPSETVETIKQTENFVLPLSHLDWNGPPEVHFVVPLPDTELFHTAVAMGAIDEPKKYIVDVLSNLGKHTRSINLTKLSMEELTTTVARTNLEIRRNFYLKHPFRFCLSLFDWDHLRHDLIFYRFSLRQVIPVLEALTWVVIGKQMYRFKNWGNFKIFKIVKNIMSSGGFCKKVVSLTKQ
jgi:anaerobic magnesium-protoporphyrin IX monomethyl ester cyclase